MATIRKRNHKWQVMIRRKGFPPLARSFAKLGDAEEWARFKEGQADRGDLPAATKELDRITLKEIIQRYRDEISIKKRSFNSEVYKTSLLSCPKVSLKAAIRRKGSLL